MAGQRFATIRQTVLDRSTRNVEFNGAVARAQIECKHERETVALSCAIDSLLGRVDQTVAADTLMLTSIDMIATTRPQAINK